MRASDSKPSQISISNDALHVELRVSAEGIVYSPAIRASGVISAASSPEDQFDLALVQLKVNGIGNHSGTVKPGKGLVGGAESLRLRYLAHRIEKDKGKTSLQIDLRDSALGLIVTSQLTLIDELPILRASTSVRNDSNIPFVINSLSSLVLGAVSARDATWWDDYELSIANNTWFREAQWETRSLPSLGLGDIGLGILDNNHNRESMATYSLSNRSTFSTQGHLPMGFLKSDKDMLLWQIENNGAWRWDIGDHNGRLYLATSGPEAADHDWRLSLGPGESYRTPYTALYRGPSDLDAAFAAMTRYRRTIVRPHPDYSGLPIIFNDYMNCLMGDPTEDKILALLEPVRSSGAAYFVIDAGWYADDEDWWDGVGRWEPSTWRFPNGFPKLLNRIRDAGLKPGVWIEPEVIGVRCELAHSLPADAFMQRDGHRIVERGRYHLDFRNPAAKAHLDKVVRRCVEEYGVRYFKFDYNIEHVLGTDVDCSSAGVGQAQHGQAYRAWVASLLDRWPELVIENCSSGGMRMEYDMLSVHTLQSTSDQQDPMLYAAIAAALPTAVLPIQGATWAYPQSVWSDEINALTVANSLFGRVHLSGRLDQLSDHQLKNIVYEGMRVYTEIRHDIAEAVPFWPLGLPRWGDAWVALGMQVTQSKAYVLVWKRKAKQDVIELYLPIGRGRSADIALVYPKTLPSKAEWLDQKSIVKISLKPKVCARLFRIEWR